MRKMEAKHGNEPKEKDNKKMAGYMVRKRYGLEVRQVTCPKRECHFHNKNKHLTNQFASFPVLLQNPTKQPTY